MARGHFSRTALTCAAATALMIGLTSATRGQEGPRAPLAFNTARVSIAGTSNIHAYTASTTTVRIARAQISPAAVGPELWDNVLKPGSVEAFEIAIPAASLSSPKDGLDKNMHKALKVEQFAEISFRLARVESAANGTGKAFGTLRIAGVEREVVLTLKTQRKDSGLAVSGELELLMTDYGIKPPVAMLGMLKTDPKVKVTFETVLAVPLT
jgi:hypothetical protein